MDEQQRITSLLERFVKGYITLAEKEEVNQLVASNAAIAEQLQTLQVLRKGMIEEELQSSRLFLQSLEKQSLKEKVGEKAKQLKQLKQQIQYSIEELKKMFAPFPAYDQYALQFAQRAASDVNLVLKAPENDMNCESLQLEFSLSKPLETEEEIEIVIEDNQSREKIAQEFEPTTQQFKINLSQANLSPGRYYWKFMVEDAVVIGSFFIQKDLMPA